MSVLIKTIEVGNLCTNCYVVTDRATMDSAVVDPGDDSNMILDYLEEYKMNVRAILVTHGHFDHTGAVHAVRAATGAPVYINSRDVNASGRPVMMRFTPDGEVRDMGEGDVIAAGSLAFSVMETPGHSPGSVSLICGDAIFTGDALFAGSCGRTDLEGGDMQVLLGSLKRLYELPGNYEVYPGHSAPTTLSRERAANYYMRYAVGEE